MNTQNFEKFQLYDKGFVEMMVSHLFIVNKLKYSCSKMPLSITKPNMLCSKSGSEKF